MRKGIPPLLLVSCSPLQVKLRDVVAFVCDTIGHNVAAACLEACIPPLVAVLTQRFEEQAAAICKRRSPAPNAVALQAMLLPLTEQLAAENIAAVGSLRPLLASVTCVSEQDHAEGRYSHLRGSVVPSTQPKGSICLAAAVQWHKL